MPRITAVIAATATAIPSTGLVGPGSPGTSKRPRYEQAPRGTQARRPPPRRQALSRCARSTTRPRPRRRGARRGDGDWRASARARSRAMPNASAPTRAAAAIRAAAPRARGGGDSHVGRQRRDDPDHADGGSAPGEQPSALGRRGITARGYIRILQRAERAASVCRSRAGSPRCSPRWRPWCPGRSG